MDTSLDLHPSYRNARFTLRALMDGEDAARSKVTRLQDEGMQVLFYQDDCPDGRTGWFVAARHDVAQTARVGLPHRKDAAWKVTAFGIALFRLIARSSYGKPVRRWYKPLDPAALRRVLQRMDWTGSNLDVASRLVSDLILAHPFPNANHRTSIDMARYYLASVGIHWPHYDLRGRGRRQRFHHDTKTFFFTSKYLLQLHRHKGLVRAAHRHGYTHLGIGPDAFVPIRPEDLDADRQAVVHRHREAARALVWGLADGGTREPLRAPRGKALHQWAEWLDGRSISRAASR